MDNNRGKKYEDIRREVPKGKECGSVNSVLNEKFPELKLDYKRLLDTYELPKVKDGKIILNPNNPLHKEWMEDEDD